MNLPLYANFVANGITKNAIFDLSNSGNRDNCFSPYLYLKDLFFRNNIVLNTPDVDTAGVVAFELHLGVHEGDKISPSYLMILETPLIRPLDWNPVYWKKYRKIFTWNDTLVDGKHFIKINFPNQIDVPVVDGWEMRDNFCCLIAGNKAVAKQNERELYSERVSAIRWFEQNAPHEFNLYGTDWDFPPALPGFVGKLTRRMWRYGLWRYVLKVLSERPFPSYCGKVGRKRDVLVRTRFAICYENVRDLPGYITEKIFDCFFSGCVPVYWGASNITDYIPVDCFIDRRLFSDTAEVYQHLKSISEEEFCGYQQRMANFLRSDAAQEFGAQVFADTIVNTIVEDLSVAK